MKATTETAPGARWAGQRERSNLAAIRLMRFIAVAMGRRVARLFLPPIALYFLLASKAARGHSRAYLTRALGREAGGREVYRHFHAFCATVLDRVYLLRERFDLFRVDASGIEALLEPHARGEGVIACGAHLGSFEALRMVGHEHGLKVAVIMYEDNARLINEALAAIAPSAVLHTIGLGRIDAMLALRRWLDEGGIGGMLADRTLPGENAQRSKTALLPFLGAPARFADGPFRLAAMLRRRVVFMAGLYHGGNRYEMRFEQLADFSSTAPGDRDAAIRAALERYVATLESMCRASPYNWFNFFDFWADAEVASSAEANAAGHEVRGAT